MIDLTWKLFSQTGNIETYLLYKELEFESRQGDLQEDNNEEIPLETKM
ncbi:YqzL family protein [Oceanobacillus piezotolerans]|uniref:YqzL family protein n=1 Tax=Oceanobacillus piezotolerans TaxID=2448030 RepID=A0A498DLY1_9BACI|nr:YqzL family protein [Oceanobacillus piezotolerans]RLL48050.1 YqzL family protein [Oceanobacillus piezotolerans]